MRTTEVADTAPNQAACDVNHMTDLPAAEHPFDKLSKRCQGVIDLLVDGHSNKEIGFRLGISEATVKAYISTILVALNVSNRTQAALIALRFRYGLTNQDKPK